MMSASPADQRQEIPPAPIEEAPLVPKEEAVNVVAVVPGSEPHP